MIRSGDVGERFVGFLVCVHVSSPSFVVVKHLRTETVKTTCFCHRVHEMNSKVQNDML